MGQDLRLAICALTRHKAFAAGAIATLALGIAATTAMFSIVYGVLLRPLPYNEPDRLVRLAERHSGATPALRGSLVSHLTLDAWSRAPQTVGAIAVFGTQTLTVGTDDPTRVEGAAVSPSLFEVLQITPAMGRFFTDEEAAADTPSVVVLSDAFWRERFGARPDALGSALALGGRRHTIVGVAPAGFAFPQPATRFWTPRRMPRVEPDGRGVSVMAAIARLAPGATVAQAAAEATAAARQHPRPLAADLIFGKGGPPEVEVRTLVDEMTASIRPALIVLLLGVAMLLLIACVNVANLLLSRGVAREREIAVRIALGAGRWRVVRQLLIEAGLLSAVAGVCGIGLAASLIALLPTLAPGNLPRIAEVEMHPTVVGIAVLAVCAAGLLSGLAPALRTVRPDLVPSLRESAGASSGTRTVRLRQLLIGAEAALAVLLLVGASLLVRSFVRLINVDAGYDATGVVTTEILLPPGERGTADTTLLLDEILPRLEAVPGVVAAGLSNMVPLNRSTAIRAFQLPVPGRETVTARALSYRITPGYAEALQLRLRAGRHLTAADAAETVQPVLVNDEFVRAFLPGVDAVGLPLPTGDREGTTSVIVGVVGNVLKDGLDAAPQPEMYAPMTRDFAVRGQINLVIRATGDPAPAVEMLRTLLRERRPGSVAESAGPLTAQIASSVAQPRFAAWVLALFAALGVLLSAVGLFSVISYSVARRQRELGVRTALGATRAHLMLMVCREGLGVALAGTAAGLALALALSRLLQAMLFGVDPLDPVSLVTAPLLLVAVAVVACVLPARRAATADPLLALRSE